MMMKYFIVLSCIVAAALAGDTDEKYTDKYDNLDLEEVMENERLLEAYVNCLVDKGKCTPEGKALKDNLRDAIETECKKCTEAQEKGVYKMVDYLIKNRLDLWKELTDKFDPEGIWRKKYEERAKAKGIEIPE